MYLLCSRQLYTCTCNTVYGLYTYEYDEYLCVSTTACVILYKTRSKNFWKFD